MSYKIKPGPGKIAVEPVGSSNEIDLGEGKKLWVPTPANNEGMTAVVVAACEPYQSDEGTQFQSNYDVGDVVVVGKYTGTRLDIDRKSYVIMREADVLAQLVEVPSDKVSS